MAVGAEGFSAKAVQHHAVLNLVQILLDHAEEGIDADLVGRVEFFLRGESVPEHVFLPA